MNQSQICKPSPVLLIFYFFLKLLEEISSSIPPYKIFTQLTNINLAIKQTHTRAEERWVVRRFVSVPRQYGTINLVAFIAT